MNKLKAGQTVWIVKKNQNNITPLERTIRKVGRKYFELSGEIGTRYVIETLELDSWYSGGYATVYLCLQDIEDEREYRAITRRLSGMFNYMTWKNGRLTLAQLRQIEAIIDPPDGAEQVSDDYALLKWFVADYLGYNIGFSEYITNALSLYYKQQQEQTNEKAN
jgi:hypothetical protein